MWYLKDEPKPKLDYSKPIVAKNSNGYTHLLLPYIEDSYKILGYDWFNLDEGKFNSCVHWKTPQEAIDSYSENHTVTNAELTVTPIT